MKRFAWALALAVLAGCTQVEKIPQPPVVIKTPDYLLELPPVTPPPDEERFVTLEPKQKVEVLSALARRLYEDIAQLARQIRTIKERQDDIVRKEGQHVQ